MLLNKLKLNRLMVGMRSSSARRRQFKRLDILTVWPLTTHIWVVLHR